MLFFYVSHLKEQWGKKNVTFGTGSNVVNLQEQSLQVGDSVYGLFGTFGDRVGGEERRKYFPLKE